jgi:hypothetical protein
MSREEQEREMLAVKVGGVAQAREEGRSGRSGISLEVG